MSLKKLTQRIAEETAIQVVNLEQELYKGKSRMTDKDAKMLIDPADEGIVIVSKNGYTRVWVNGKRIDNVTNISFSTSPNDYPKLNLEIAP